MSTSGRFGNTDRDGYLDAINQYFIGSIYADTILQNQLYTDRGNQYDGRISYTEPLGKKQYLSGTHMQPTAGTKPIQISMISSIRG
ncbi:MAG: hypothetical protein IPJ09_17595 [Saprospiraceae bacterium]|nr:hypothetical protein [Saprospiraceae bacterium]